MENYPRLTREDLQAVFAYDLERKIGEKKLSEVGESENYES